ncbi:MAG: aminoglycoside phosphotransferase [Streptosporangiales bacterium]|nr:aminoglycoside phosphotransferase [Streptosporangiales bacterium]
MAERLEECLAEWLPRQRWFAGKDRELTHVTVLADTELRPGDPSLRHLVVAAHQGHQDETADRYQVLLGRRTVLPDRLRHVEIGQWDGGHGYDAAHDAGLTGELLERFASEAGAGRLGFHRLPPPVTTGLPSLVIGGEQSNTTLIYGEEYVCKLFRRLWPGVNPDLELTAALAARRSRHVARPHGWFEMPLDGEPTTLGLLQEYLRTATDGWVLAATSVRDLYASPEIPVAEAGGDFSGEAGRLGRATAEVHRDLAQAFDTGVVPGDELIEVAHGMHARLSTAVAAVPALAPYAERVGVVFDEFAKLERPLPVQRVHGDYHLGQVVRTHSGWVLLDFEGEPAKPVTERRAMSSPLRDVAGMLRSFDYAARHQLIGHPDESRLAGVARSWAAHNRDAFCAGYAEAAGGDPREQAVALRAYEFDKAVYEVVYEARNRPSWLRIPLDSIAALVGADPVVESS